MDRIEKEYREEKEKLENANHNLRRDNETLEIKLIMEEEDAAKWRQLQE